MMKGDETGELMEELRDQILCIEPEETGVWSVITIDREVYQDEKILVALRRLKYDMKHNKG